MRRSTRIIIAIDAVALTAFIFVFLILPALFGLQPGSFGYVPFFLFFFPFFGGLRRKKAASGYDQNNSQQAQPPGDSGTEQRKKDQTGDTTDYFEMGNNGTFKGASRISWQFIAFIIILLAGVSFLILWYGI